MSKGRFLNIGVNFLDTQHYGSDGKLGGCVNDANAMHQLARDQGFVGQVLLNEEATRSNVIRSINQAAAELEAGDILFISYSGHGGYLPDHNRDEEDGHDETWCLHDGELLDDELNLFWSRFKAGVRILVISDSCHSGTVIKPAQPNIPYSTAAARQLTDEQALAVWENQKDFYQGIRSALPVARPEIKAAVRLLSGCQDNQQSYDGQPNGAFTTQLLRVWDQGRFTGSYQRFHKQILMRMPAHQSPNHLLIGAANPVFDEENPFSI